MQHLLHHRVPRNGLERRPAREQLVEDGAQRVHISRGADFVGASGRLLRGHVTGGAEDDALLGQRGAVAVEALGEAEIGDLGDQGFHRGGAFLCVLRGE